METLKKTFAILIFTCFCSGHIVAQTVKYESDIKGYKVEEFSHKDLKKWGAFGFGDIDKNHKQTLMFETDGSLGYMLVSPESYGENVVLSYDVMAINAATVLVVEMAAHNRSNHDLSIDSGYDGNVKYLFENVNMYMFAFHNAVHNKNGPFVRKYPEPGSEPLFAAKKNVFEVGKYYNVKIGMEQGKIWFKVNGKKIFKIRDNEHYKGGKIILRVRGTGHELGACIIKNVKVYSKIN